MIRGALKHRLALCDHIHCPGYAHCESKASSEFEMTLHGKHSYWRHVYGRCYYLELRYRRPERCTELGRAGVLLSLFAASNSALSSKSPKSTTRRLNVGDACATGNVQPRRGATTTARDSDLVSLAMGSRSLSLAARKARCSPTRPRDTLLPTHQKVCLERKESDPGGSTSRTTKKFLAPWQAIKGPR